jgi:hypothetical protein
MEAGLPGLGLACALSSTLGGVVRVGGDRRRAQEFGEELPEMHESLLAALGHELGDEPVAGHHGLGRVLDEPAGSSPIAAEGNTNATSQP